MTTKNTSNNVPAAKKTAKKAAKKTAKRGAKPATEAVPDVVPVTPSGRIAGLPNSSGILSDSTKAVQKSLRTIQAKAKTKATSSKTVSELYKELLPIEEIGIEYLIGSRGLPARTFIELIAAEGVGKTTIISWIFGRLMEHGSVPCLYIECEDKPMSPDRIQRMLHKDKITAHERIKDIHFMTARTLDEMDKALDDWCIAVRQNVPIHIPIYAAIDPWNKLMNATEAAGRSEFGVTAAVAAKQKKREVGAGSNQLHAKWCHAWMRTLPARMEKYNLTVMTACHQNDKVDMTGMSPMFQSEKKNETTLGGRAKGQNAAIKLTLVNSGDWKNPSKKSIGTYVTATATKLSYGPKFRELRFRIRTDDHADTEFEYGPTVDFSPGTADLLHSTGMLGVTLSNKLYSSEHLGVSKVEEEELYAAFLKDPQNKMIVGQLLKLDGYIDINEEIARIKRKRAEGGDVSGA